MSFGRAEAAITLDDAQLAVRPKKRKATNGEWIAALDTIEKAHRPLTLTDSWRDAARRQILRGLLAKRVVEGRNEREPVQWRAARALQVLRPDALTKVLFVLEKEFMDEDDYVVSHRVCEALCVSLLRIDAARATDFLVEEMIVADTDEPSWHRTRAALRALAAAPLPDARRRHAATKRLLAIFQSFPFHVEEDYDHVADLRDLKKRLRRNLSVHGRYWADLRPLVTRLLTRYTADPNTGRLARDVDHGHTLDRLERFKVWNGLHKNRHQTPWINPSGKPLPRTHLREVRVVRPMYVRFVAPWPVYARVYAPPMPPQGGALAKERARLRETTLGPLLTPLLVDPAFEVRGMAAVGLGRLGPPQAARRLLHRLDRETDERVREAIAYGLLLLRDPSLHAEWRRRAVDADENPQVRAIALLALGCGGDTEPLRAFLAKAPRKTHTDAELIASALAGLGIAGEDRDAPLFVRTLQARNTLPGERGAAAAAMGRRKLPETFAQIITLTDSDDTVQRAAAAHALSGPVLSGDRRRLARFRRLLLEPRGKAGAHRVEAAFALARIGGRDAGGILMEAARRFGNDTERVAEYGSMLLALAAVGGPRAPEEMRRHFTRAKFEWDAGAAALGLARLGQRGDAFAIGARLSTAERRYISSAITALGLLRDAGSTGEIRLQIARRPGDRALRSGARALARIRGAGAAQEIWSLWTRAIEPADYQALAEALGLAGPDGTDLLLQARAIDAKQGAIERAFAVQALVAMATPGRAIDRRLRGAFFIYDAPRTLTRLVRFGDRFFFAGGEEG